MEEHARCKARWDAGLLCWSAGLGKPDL
jgi:hypothetical protein